MGADSRSLTYRAAVGELTRGALEFGIQLSAEQQSAFDVYIDTLLFWAKRLSLTGAATAVDLVSMHLLDSLAVARLVQAGWQVADVGSGAGFPGIPLAIVHPGAALVLIESRRKRANFLRETARRCNLANVEVLEERADSVARRRPESFDLVVSRALWSIAELLRVCRLLVRRPGLAIAMKGPRAATEIVRDAAFSDPELIAYRLPGGANHVLVVYRRR